ncbi:MAG: hypothetical protein U5P10_08325 [Spirochaetia bacterium]|nr:hypothetical protein [Spirochaetia bacterium]
MVRYSTGYTQLWAKKQALQRTCCNPNAARRSRRLPGTTPAERPKLPLEGFDDMGNTGAISAPCRRRRMPGSSSYHSWVCSVTARRYSSPAGHTYIGPVLPEFPGQR